MASRDYSAEIDALKKDMETIRDDLGTLTQTLRADASERVSRATLAARTQADETWRGLQSSAEDAHRGLVREVETNPLASLLMAVGLGFLIGAISRR